MVEEAPTSTEVAKAPLGVPVQLSGITGVVVTLALSAKVPVDVEALDVIVKVPLAGPAAAPAAGAAVMPIVQDPVAAEIPTEHVFVATAKPTEAVTPLTVNAGPPVLVSVTVCTPLLVPAWTLPKTSGLGAKVKAGTGM